MAAKGRSGRAQRASPSNCRCFEEGAGSAAIPGCGQGVGCDRHNFRARCPSRLRAAGCGLGLFGSRTTFRLPTPGGGWSCSAGANPGLTGVASPGAGGTS